MSDVLLRPDLTFSDDDYRLGPEGAIRRRCWPELSEPVGWD